MGAILGVKEKKLLKTEESSGWRGGARAEDLQVDCHFPLLPLLLAK